MKFRPAGGEPCSGAMCDLVSHPPHGFLVRFVVYQPKVLVVSLEASF